MISFKKAIAVISLLSLFTFMSMSLATAQNTSHDAYHAPLENFDPSTELQIHSNDSTEFRWNGSDTGSEPKRLPLYAFNLCFEYISSSRNIVVDCKQTSPLHAFINHYTISSNDWTQIINNLQNKLKAKGDAEKPKDQKTLSLDWHVEGVYTNGMEQEIIKSEPWTLTLQQ